MRSPRLLALLLCAVAAACRRAPDTPVQGLINDYAPGIRLGSTVKGAALRKYQLAKAPYVGYSDSTYFGPDGLRRLYIKVDQYVDDNDTPVSPGARVEWVSMTVTTPMDVKVIEQHMRAALGAPEETCFRGLPHGRRIRSLYWTGARGAGARLVIPRDAWHYRDLTPAGPKLVADRAVLALGVDRPPPASLQTERCPAS